jgi:hypothetical protein
VQELEHPGHLRARAPPDGLLVEPSGVVLELARRERAVTLELAQDVAPQAGLLLHELPGPGVPRLRAPRRAHQSFDQRQVLARIDERVPFEELSLIPEQPVELCPVVPGDAAPENEMLRRRDGRDRVDLEAAEVPDRRQDVGRRPVEQLRTHGDAPGLPDRKLAHVPRTLLGGTERSCAC